MEGLEFCETGGEGLCETYGQRYTVRWKAPRTKGVQIRVYAVTECLSDDSTVAMIDGWCLRESTANGIAGAVDPSITVPFDHTAPPPPSSMLVLLAKGPSSKGRLTWESPDGLLGYEEGDDAWNSGPEVYSIVVAAFDKTGQHSAFAIADSTHVCMLIESMECPDDHNWPPGDGE